MIGLIFLLLGGLMNGYFSLELLDVFLGFGGLVL